MKGHALLLDYHGVISDGGRLPGEWRRLLGEFFSPRFGKAPAVWGEANRHALDRSLQRMRNADPTSDEEESRRSDRIEWLRDMFRFAEVAMPDPLNADDIALEAIAYVVPRTRATVPGAADALRELHALGYALYTASGDHSSSLNGYLGGLGVRELFTQTYGADLLGVPKTSQRFYRALLTDAGLEPRAAVVIDDDAYRLDWARELEMETILVGTGAPSATHRRVGTIAELPAALHPR